MDENEFFKKLVGKTLEAIQKAIEREILKKEETKSEK